MAQRFSKNELIALRNNIPIDSLIRDTLLIPVKYSEGFFRFLCPLCNEFQTSTMAKINLARCFRCEKNFNTIEMVMFVQKKDFVESVKFLKKMRSTTQNEIIDNKDYKKKNGMTGMPSLGEIFNSSAFLGKKSTPEKRSGLKTNKYDKTLEQNFSVVPKQIINFENKIDILWHLSFLG